MFNPYMFPNPYQMQMQQMQQQQQPQQGLQFVNGPESAAAYAMPPNSKAILMDSGMPRFYLKETDAAGASKVTAYDFSEAKAAPQNDYVTRQEFEALKEMIANEPAHAATAE